MANDMQFKAIGNEHPRGRAARPSTPGRAGIPDQGCKAGINAGATCPAHACLLGPGSGPARCRDTRHVGEGR